MLRIALVCGFLVVACGGVCAEARKQPKQGGMGPSDQTFETLGENMAGEGIGFNESVFIRLCTKDTDFGSQLTAALEACPSNSGNRAVEKDLVQIDVVEAGDGEDRQRPGRGCPTGEDAVEMFLAEIGEFACIYQELGWFDDGDFQQSAYEASVASLPPTVAPFLAQDKVDTCTQAVMEKVINNRRFRRCARTYTEEEQAQIAGLLEVVGSAVCVRRLLDHGCRVHLDNVIGNLLNA